MNLPAPDRVLRDADTITDEEIERLRDQACACRDAKGNKPPIEAPEEHAGVFNCDVSTYDTCVTALEACDEEGWVARHRCAAILNAHGIVGPSIALEWYDGPLLEIAKVDFPDGKHLVEIDTCLYALKTPDNSPVQSPIPREQRAVIRLSRGELQAMLDLLDGKPVKDFHDK